MLDYITKLRQQSSNGAPYYDFATGEYTTWAAVEKERFQHHINEAEAQEMLAKLAWNEVYENKSDGSP